MNTFIKDLQTKLKTIGWSSRHCGCGIYNVISCHNKPTEFMFNDYAIWIENNNSNLF